MGLGLRIIWHAKWRFLLSAAGIAMAVAIMFLQQGFFYSALDSQSRIAHLIRGDLVVLHRNRTHLNKWNSLNKIHIFQTGALASVEQVIPLYKGQAGLLNKQTERVKRIIVYAFPPDAMPLDIGPPDEVLPELRMPRTLLFDRKSRDIYGRIERGQDLDLDGRQYRVAGFVDVGPNILNDGAVVMSDGNWLPVASHPRPVMGVIRIKAEGDVEAVRRAIRDLFPDLLVMSPAELAEREMKFTATSAPIGIIFGIGMIAGLVIGLVVCYQVLFNETNDLIPQYATLKAMGFSGRFLGRIILEQALMLSVLGFTVAMPAVWYLYDLLARRTSMVMALVWDRALVVFSLTVVMCIVAGVMALQRVLRTNPADLY